MSAALGSCELRDPARAKVLGPSAQRRSREPELRLLRIVASPEEELDVALVEREFPTVHVVRTERPEPGELVIDDFAWRGAFEFGPVDERVAQARPLARVAVRGVDAAGVAVEVLARYQRLVARRNPASSTSVFDAVLEGHAALFDPSVPPMGDLDHDHALDTWQWLLRLAPAASLTLQLAALFHEVERLDTEPLVRLEHRVHRSIDPNAGPSSARPPSGSVDRTEAALRAAGVSETDVRRVCELVAGLAPTDPETRLLDDADALSFLSLMSARYADHFGLAQTRRKVTFMLARMGPAAREKVGLFRLRPDVDRLLQLG